MTATPTTTDRNFGLAAVFEDTATLRAALDALHAVGVPAPVLSVLGKDHAGIDGVEPAAESPVELAEELEPTAREGLIGGVLGAYAGLWGSLLLLAVPGVGQAVAAGGAAALLAHTATTAAAGLGLGGMLGVVLHGDHTDHHRRLYQAAIERGGWVLVVHGTEAEYELCAKVLKGQRPSHVDHFLN